MIARCQGIALTLAAAGSCVACVLSGIDPLAIAGVGLGLLLPVLGWRLHALAGRSRLRRLQACEGRLRATLDTAADAVIAMDCAGAIVEWSRSAEGMFGWSRDEVLGRQLAETIVPVRDREAHRRGLRRFVESGETRVLGRRLELTALHRDGSELPVEIVIASVSEPDGWTFAAHVRNLGELKKSKRVLAGALDALDRRNLELTVARDAACRATQAKAEFLANMSHQLRTPMSGVVGVADLLLETELSAEQRELVGIIRDSGDALIDILNEVLDYSRGEAQKLELEAVELDPRAILEDVADLLAQKAHPRGVERIADIDPALPRALIGDPGRLRQVLVNLVGNAVKFTEEGQVIVRASVLERSGDRISIRIAVQDTGIGIASEARARLLESFTQADSSMSRRHGGTGLGLAISRKLVELMDGKIDFESQPGTGSTFWFTAWLRLAAEPAAPAIDPLLSGRRALIVDGNAAATDALERSLRDAGLEARSVREPGAALEALRDAVRRGEEFDVALVDLRLIERRGADLFAQIRDDPALAGLRTILCRPLGARGSGSGRFDVDATAIVSKPIRRDHLQASLAACLGREAGTASIPAAPGGPSSEVAAPSDAPARAAGLRILIADDDATHRTLLRRFVHKLGHVAEEAADGAAVLRMTAEIAFDVILLDCEMPDVDGPAAARRLREQEGAPGPGGRRTTIVAMTGSAMPEDRARCLSAGMDDHLSKPLRFRELADILVRRGETREASPARR